MCHQIWEFTRYLLLNMNSDSLVVTVAVVQLLSLSDSMWPYGLQHSRLLCPPLYPGVCSNLWPLSRWCYQSSHLLSNPSSFCLQSFPAAESFTMSQLFASGNQRIEASASVFPMIIQCWFSFELTGLISLLSKGLSRVFFSTTIQKHPFFNSQPSL